MASRRTDFAVGLVVLGGSYGVQWLVRRRPKTRAERLVADAKSTGHGTAIALAALFRIALADKEFLTRAGAAAVPRPSLGENPR
jgi:hypothetical protein